MTHQILFIEEGAQERRVAISTVRHWISTGRLASVRPGRRRMVRRVDLDEFVAAAFKPAIDVGARGLTTRGGDPGRLTPTADPSVDGVDPRQRLLWPAHSAWPKEGEDRPGLAGGEAQSAEGAQPPGSCPGAPCNGERARICGSTDGDAS